MQPSIKSLPHPLTRLVAAALVVTAGLYSLFFLFAERIWAMRADIPMSQITPWARWAMVERDGAEPPVLLLLVLSAFVLTGVLAKLLERCPPRWIQPVMGASFGFVLLNALRMPPLPPFMQLSSNPGTNLASLLGVLALGFVVSRASRSRLGWLALALLLVPVCFLFSTQPHYDDLSTVLAPALRLRHGFSFSEIYFQYDYFPSLLALAWMKLGGDPLAFGYCTAALYYLMLGACLFVARRMFHDQRLPGFLLTALIVIRIYAVVSDANASPQVTPIRLDWWVYLLAVALAFGLRHWSVGLCAGVLYFACRSFGMLYLGGYGLALIAEFFASRHAAKERLPFLKDAMAALRQTAPSLALIGIAGMAGALSGGVVSDAVTLYRRLGVGMLPINSFSSFWWILPVLLIAGWLAFTRFVPSDRTSAAALFAVALAVSNSIYFLARSDEHNLINISASLLFCVFLAIDRFQSAATEQAGPRWALRLMPAVPWLILTIAALAYSGRIVRKVNVQVASVLYHAPLPALDGPGALHCPEIAAAAHDSKVFVYSPFNYWYDERCGYVPQGTVQPFFLELLQARAVQYLDGLLNAGYKIAVPKEKHWKQTPDPWSYNQFNFDEMEASLKGMERVETAHFFIYRRAEGPVLSSAH